MSIIKVEPSLRWVSKELPRRLDLLEDVAERPEDPCFQVYYNPHTKKWRAQLGTNYAGWYEAEAEIPVIYPQQFNELKDLILHFMDLLNYAEGE